MRLRFFFSIILGAMLVLLTSSVVLAQDPTPVAVADDRVNEVAKQLYCPVCENTPLDVCPTQACAQWRDLIRLKLSQGWSLEQIKSYFADQYGERVLATPRAKGFNWLLILVPVLAFVAGAFILYRALKSLSRSMPGVVTPTSGGVSGDSGFQFEKTSASANVQDEYIKRVEEELRKR